MSAITLKVSRAQMAEIMAAQASVNEALKVVEIVNRVVLASFELGGTITQVNPETLEILVDTARS